MRNGFATNIGIVQGNYGFPLSFIVTDSQGNIVDLSNASMEFQAQLDSDNSIQFNGSMTIDSPTAGTCHYMVQQTDFPQAGIWNVQLIATYSGEILTWTGITVTADAQLPVN